MGLHLPLLHQSFAYFAVLNVVTGVFCQSAIDGAQNDHATKVHSTILAHKEAHLEQIRRLFSKLDAEDSGIITYDMFQERINSPAVRNFFATLGLDIWDAWSFFKCLDLDAGGAVEIEEFLMGCLRLRGQATAIDVGKIISNQTWQLRNQGHFQAYIEVKLQELTSQMATLTGVNGLSDEQMEMMFAKHGDESPEDSVINLSRKSKCSASSLVALSLDLPEVLAAKAALLIQLLRRSHYTVAYTGAGISTAAGIKDYASKASHSRALALVTETSPEQGLTASPTASHRFFAALYRRDLLHHWVQQNHDGLPQKAGYAQEALNEIHGSWFDPSNPVVHFRAELRAANFAWLLEAELRAQLVIAVGTSLCDTPSTADRLVVTCAQRARERQEVCGACVVGLQRTRLDRFAQLRVFCEADRFFELVAQELWKTGIPASPTAASREDGATGVMYITSGPSQGRALQVRGTREGHLELDGGLLLGAWWPDTPAHRCPAPLSLTAVPRNTRQRRVLEAARLAEAPVSVPSTFLAGRWRGDAVLISGRKDHPTAPPERAQDLCWVLGGDKELRGAGFTTWPAAHVLLGVGGRVFHTIRGTYEDGALQLDLHWETSVASRCPGEKLSPEQGGSAPAHVQVSGRVWWDDRRGALLLAGLWQEEGASGALLLTRETSDAGLWEGDVDGNAAQWVLSL
ncbi:unnamed protein product, partial [Effrenium voratum]